MTMYLIDAFKIPIHSHVISTSKCLKTLFIPTAKVKEVFLVK